MVLNLDTRDPGLLWMMSRLASSLLGKLCLHSSGAGSQACMSKLPVSPGRPVARPPYGQDIPNCNLRGMYYVKIGASGSQVLQLGLLGFLLHCKMLQ